MSESFDGFTVAVFLDKKGDWIANFAELPEISAYGDTPESALQELEIAWEAVKESCQAEGKPVPKNYSME